ncbi:ABC transporter permease [Bacillus sp. HMF5848]|uniref:ABC transporter permease n=1 Tax=Bacillus sp. HMF5848 TaxID=2495421 RepID=UPI000F7B6936|nr:ABC transporter permease [Bacillus sp. HMF5848]RSK26104.1 ABC transporter permease [Bacillus sp. HMF5848]
MTFKDIALKNFTFHLRRYVSYFVCSSFTVMIFFMYSTLLLNDELINNPQVAANIMNNLIVPTVALVIFSVVFISYAYSSFIKSRQYEFGLFMSLGMPNKQIVRIIALENGLIAIASILAGILCGAIFSRIFFLLVLKVIQVTGIEFMIPPESYVVTLGTFFTIFLIAILFSIITAYRFQPLQLLKGIHTPSKNKISNPILALVGIISIIASTVSLCFKFASNEEVTTKFLLITTIICLVGVYLTISQVGGFLLKHSKKNKAFYYKHLRFITSLDYRFKQTKKILFASTIMVMVTTFYCGAMFYFLSSAEKLAIESHPYHVAFIQLSDKNNMPEAELKAILNSGETSLSEHKTLEVMEVKMIYRDVEQQISRKAISVDHLNHLTGSTYHVESGHYVLLNQVPIENDENALVNLTLKTRNKHVTLQYEESINKLYFNRLHTLWADIIVVNTNDYKELKRNSESTAVQYVHLLNFEDWRQTQLVVNRLNEEFSEYNQTTPPNEFVAAFGETEEDFFHVQSRMEHYLTQKQGSSMLLFISAFLGIFFFIAASIMLSFKLFSEMDDEKLKYKQLSGIGIRDREIRKTINQELGIVFFTPVVLGASLSLLYIYAFTREGSNIEPLQYNLLVSMLYLVFQFIYYFIIRKVYSDKVIESLV